jgi:NAD(P) transhydrogenase subunit beta
MFHLFPGSALLEVLCPLTLTGSLMAAGKLQETQRPIVSRPNTSPDRRHRCAASRTAPAAVSFQSFVLGLISGVLLIIPIGGADMPTVISLLNSYAGLAAAAMGFVLDNKLLIIAGALDGSSGFILSVIMSKAMNRSFTNVLFGAFGQVQSSAGVAAETRTTRSATPEEAAAILSAANKSSSFPVTCPGAA